jgi:NAD(P)-dependent dehydrogenase (short-subunit alcohol dehydrogenase family)
MKDFKDRVVVITGAASGIGLGLAECCARECMNVVMADIEESSLAKAGRRIKAMGANVLWVRTDVSKAADVEALARKALDNFGEVHLLFNNAGVDAKNSVRESTLADWQWVLGVNLWGVINGICSFMPVMLGQSTECHIVNTASTAGLYTDWCGSPYTVSKHAIVAISEILYRELEHGKYNVGVSVLCPGPIDTNLMESERNRPLELHNQDKRPSISQPKIHDYMKALTQVIKNVMPPRQVGDIVFDAIREKRFYIFANAGFAKTFVKARMEDILQERNPTNVPLETIRVSKTMGS